MRQLDDDCGGGSPGHGPEDIAIGPCRRLLFAFIGLLTGNAALLLFLLQGAVRLRAALLKAHLGEPASAIPQAWDMFVVYAIVSLVGWTLVASNRSIVAGTSYFAFGLAAAPAHRWGAGAACSTSHFSCGCGAPRAP